MPKIATFMYCDKAEPAQEGGLRIERPLLAFTPAFIPGMFSFSVVAGITDLDIKTDHTLRIIFTGPNSDEPPLVDTKTIPIGDNIELESDNDLPPEHSGIIFNLDFRNVILKNEGIYKTEIIIDGKKISEHPIFVKKGKWQ